MEKPKFKMPEDIRQISVKRITPEGELLDPVDETLVPNTTLMTIIDHIPKDKVVSIELGKAIVEIKKFLEYEI